MGWSFDYLKKLSDLEGVRYRSECISKKHKTRKKHKADFWFGEWYCKRCNVKINPDTFKKD